MIKSTNYTNAFILVSPDSTATSGQEPSKPGSIAWIQHRMLCDRPYHFTSDDLLFLTQAERAGIPQEQWTAAREEFFAKPKACLRTSPLVKQFGWGLHHDGRARVALHGVESDSYRQLSEQAGITVVNGMRSSRR
jgi:hypothetical protein